MLTSLSVSLGQLFGVAPPDLSLTALMTALIAIAFSGYASMLLIILRWIATNTYGEVMYETKSAKWFRKDALKDADLWQAGMVLLAGYVTFVCVAAIVPAGALKFVAPGLVLFGYTYALLGKSGKTSK